ncbi:MAG: DUF4020 domain-containing protein [Gammaproteobacteria bacterium]|nr:DUF4020 domain-containing protein [Gammaproteobacteria bacterium]
MKISGIEFPGRLLDALGDDKLVVFAGAGVSMGEPARLPSFRELAEAIAQGTGELSPGAEPETRFLDRLYIDGVEVHSIAAQALSRADLEPTDLHQSLLRLYPRANSTRIVTTNFDMLFEQAAKGVFGSQPEAFRAPALPQGGKFNGIVHVHGSIDRHEEMVLTDADFGKAYLTDGSARRFLVDLFDSFTILFVGYSHEDVVMRYLGGALRESGQGNRFVLTHETDDSKWQLLGIEPVLYEKSPEGSHAALQEGIDGLVNYARRGVLDWQRDITDIASRPPSLDEEAMDLVDDALSNPMRARFFTDSASDPEWIAWLDRHEHLDMLFVASDHELAGQHVQLARWLAETFAHDHADLLSLLIQSKGMRLHRVFWWELARTVGSDRQPPVDRDVLARWVSLLLTTMPPVLDEHVLLRMGQRCADAELAGSLVDVFDAMLVHHLRLKPGYATPGDGGAPQVTAEFEPSSGEFVLRQLWERQVRPRLDQIAEPLLMRAVHKFVEQHHLLRVWEAADDNWDATSFRRSAIEPHEQDSHPQAIDVLIDAARDCLQHLVVEQPEVAAHWCDYLVRADAPLLRRLAVHALPSRSDLTGDEKTDWLLANVGLHDRAAHHETFRAMRFIYPHVSAERREAIIEAIFDYASPDRSDGRTEIYSSYRHFTWLDWLHHSDPNCDLVGQRLNAMRERRPDFEPRVHPDLTHFMSVGEGPQSPWTVEELLSRPAGEWFDDLVGFQDADSFDSSRDALLSAISDAAIQEFTWGVALADALAVSDHWDSDLWPALLRAWSREMDEDKHRILLERLANTDLYSRHTSAVANVLYELVKNGRVPYAVRLLPVANQLAASLWGALDPSERVLEIDDWLHRAINHSAGTLAEFWVHSLSVTRQPQDPKPCSFDEEYASAFSGMIGDRTVAGQLAKTILARYLAFLLAADEGWARKYLLPLFENPDADAYRPVWHGVLYSDLNAQAATALEDAFLQAMTRIEDLFPPELRRQFVECYASIAVYLVDDPLNSWIPQFFANASEQDKHWFACKIGHYLRDADDAKREDWWKRWIKEYWMNRLQGIPAPLADAEVAAMLGWVPDLKTVFPEAVECAIQMPNTAFEDTLILHDLNEGDAWSKHPEATVKLLVYMADCEPPPWVWHEAEELIKKLRGLDLPEELDTQLRELAVRLNLA